VIISIAGCLFSIFAKLIWIMLNLNNCLRVVLSSLLIVAELCNLLYGEDEKYLGRKGKGMLKFLRTYVMVF